MNCPRSSGYGRVSKAWPDCARRRMYAMVDTRAGPTRRALLSGKAMTRAGNAAEPQPGPGTARAVADVSRVRMTLTRPGRNSGLDRTAPPKPTETTWRPSHNLTGPQDSLLSIITRG
jgi:hypothetical protein